ncbi:MAG: L-2-amino-thiazoline-4-carboxylic acid hydrolase [Maledivibacter sp.]|jgi:hypothetical protein|nr:L-2-amino-thiazoline-4-carboxylic acid hydrolase [Maledivibacter sp.]
MNIKKAEKHLRGAKKIIEEHVGKEKREVFISETLVQYKNIEPHGIKYTQSLNKSNFDSGVLGLSIYRTLIGHFNFEQNKAICILTDILKIVKSNEIEGFFLSRFIISKVGKMNILKRIMEKSMYSLNEPNGWEIKKCECDAYLAFDICQCGLYNWLKEQGAEEICTAFCEIDYVTAQYMEGLKLVRTKTIANGDKICDFRYVKNS